MVVHYSCEYRQICGHINLWIAYFLWGHLPLSYSFILSFICSQYEYFTILCYKCILPRVAYLFNLFLVAFLFPSFLFLAILHSMWVLSSPNDGLNECPLRWKLRALTTGRQWNSIHPLEYRSSALVHKMLVLTHKPLIILEFILVYLIPFSLVIKFVKLFFLCNSFRGACQLWLRKKETNSQKVSTNLSQRSRSCMCWSAVCFAICLWNCLSVRLSWHSMSPRKRSQRWFLQHHLSLQRLWLSSRRASSIISCQLFLFWWWALLSSGTWSFILFFLGYTVWLAGS